MRVDEILNEFGAANGPPNLNKSDIQRMMPPAVPATATTPVKQTSPTTSKPTAQNAAQTPNTANPTATTDPEQPIEEQIPTISDPNPREQPHPADQALGAIRTLKKLSGIDRHDVENAVNQEITNVVRSPQDPSSKNVSILNRLFGRD